MASSKAKTDVWMPLYVADYLADTSRLTTVQHGAYLLLIMDYWRNGSLPDDDSILAQITKMQPDAWSNTRAYISKFFSIENGQWFHKRIEAEILKATDNAQKAHDRAVKAAQARWDKDNAQSNAASNATSNNDAVHVQCPSPSPSPSPKSKPCNSKTITPSALLASLDISETLACDFIKLRSVKKAPITKTAMDGIEREAKKAGISFEDAIKVCCERGWAGFKADWFFKDAPKVVDSSVQADRVRKNLFGEA